MAKKKVVKKKAAPKKKKSSKKSTGSSFLNKLLILTVLGLGAYIYIDKSGSMDKLDELKEPVAKKAGDIAETFKEATEELGNKIHQMIKSR